MRFVQALLEACAIVVLLVFVVSQILLPALKGTRLFPFFTKERKLKSQIADELQKHQEDALAGTLNELRFNPGDEVEYRSNSGSLQRGVVKSKEYDGFITVILYPQHRAYEQDDGIRVVVAKKLQLVKEEPQS